MNVFIPTMHRFAIGTLAMVAAANAKNAKRTLKVLNNKKPTCDGIFAGKELYEKRIQILFPNNKVDHV